MIVNVVVDANIGAGKTTLLYLLKGVKSVDHSVVSPPLEQIHSRCFITLPNSRDLYSANLYDILTNFEANPNIELIDWALQSAKMADRLNKNDFVDIEKLSGGERIRVLIARIIYAVKTRNYNVLLFDEIDENLNDKLAEEVCKNLREIFKDKIILYVTHNEKVKQLFEKKIFVKKGVIEEMK